MPVLIIWVIPLLGAVISALFIRRVRLFSVFYLIGMLLCLLAGPVNLVLYRSCGEDIPYLVTTLTPVSEELLKMAPVLFFACVIDPERRGLLIISFAVGSGFAFTESAVVLYQHLDTATARWALFRLLGASVMHSTCTAAVGMAIGFISRRKKLFYCGTLAAFVGAVIYHATFNALIISEYEIYGYFLPILLILPLLVRRYAFGEKQ